jgi:hypothetical protein
MPHYKTKIYFDDHALDADLQKLPFEALQHILDLILNDRSRLPLNIFLCEQPTAGVARSANQIVIGLGFSIHAKSSVAT